jgi:hypothetical protein
MGKPIATPTMLGDDPVVVDGDFTFTLGVSAVVADSFLEYGQAPWSYQAQTPDGARRSLTRIDWDWTSYLGDRYLQPLRFNADSLATAGDGARPVRAVLGYGAPEGGRFRIEFDLKPSGKGDGVDFKLLHNGQVILDEVLMAQPLIDWRTLDLAANDRLEFVFGPNQTAGGDVVRYRVRILHDPTLARAPPRTGAALALGCGNGHQATHPGIGGFHGQDIRGSRA